MVNHDRTISPVKKPEYVIGWKQAWKEEEIASVEELAGLLAEIHKFPTEWYEEFRELIK